MAPRVAVSLAALLATGCATALKEPPPLATMQTGASGVAASSLLEEARAAYARRPDLASVRRAEALCLEAAQADEASIDGLVCAAQAKSWLGERERDRAAREQLAVSAVQVGQWCRKRAPESAACRYWLGVALGMQARERPSTAEDGLKRMVTLLREAAQGEPAMDEAGPYRVLAILLCRAPGWPIGPGDVEEALATAQKAVALRPDFPPNQLALGEALAKNDRAPEAREAYRRARQLAVTSPGAADPDAPTWAREADARLKELQP